MALRGAAVTNSAPVYATALPNRSGQTGGAVSWTLASNTFTDANGDSLTYALWVEIPAHTKLVWNPQAGENGEWEDQNVAAQWVAGSNAGLSIASNGSISGNLGALSADSQTFYNYRAKIVATDPASASAEGVFNISANVAPTAPPVTAPLAKQHLGYSLLLPVFTDANGDASTYTVGNLPPGLSFNAATRVISGTPTSVGSWTVSYSANDGRTGTASTTFVFSVSAPVANQPPVVANVIRTRRRIRNILYSYAFPANTFLDRKGDAELHGHENRTAARCPRG